MVMCAKGVISFNRMYFKGLIFWGGGEQGIVLPVVLAVRLGVDREAGVEVNILNRGV